MDVLVTCFHLVNHFFNFHVRDSESNWICFVWTSGVLFGWVKLLLELKNLVEFLIRHLVWGIWWKRQLNYTNARSRELLIKDLKMYAQNRPLFSAEPHVTTDAVPDSSCGKCWVVITGAASSIGYEFCRQTASKGFNVCLIDENEKELAKLARELESAHDVKTMTIGFRFSGATTNRLRYKQGIMARLDSIGVDAQGRDNGEEISMLILTQG